MGLALDPSGFLPAMRSQPEVQRLLANRGRNIASLQIGNRLRIVWVRMECYRCSPAAISAAERNALRKLRKLPELEHFYRESLS